MFRLFVLPYLVISVLFPFFCEVSKFNRLQSLWHEPQSFWNLVWLGTLISYAIIGNFVDKYLNKTKIRNAFNVIGIISDIVLVYMISRGVEGYFNMFFAMILSFTLSFLFVIFTVVRPPTPIALQESLLILVIGPVMMNLVQIIYFNTWVSGKTLVDFTPIAFLFFILSCNRHCVGQTNHRYLGDVIGGQDTFRLTVMIILYTTILVTINSLQSDVYR